MEETKQSIIKKLVKVKALMNSPNQGEAEVAHKIYSELISKYSIEKSDIEQESNKEILFTIEVSNQFELNLIIGFLQKEGYTVMKSTSKKKSLKYTRYFSSKSSTGYYLKSFLEFHAKNLTEFLKLSANAYRAKNNLIGMVEKSLEELTEDEIKEIKARNALEYSVLVSNFHEQITGGN